MLFRSHRPRMDWALAEARNSADAPSARVFRGTKDILARRAATHALHGGVPVRVVASGSVAIFAFQRLAPTGTLLGLFNFTEHWQSVSESWVRAQGVTALHDALSDTRVAPHQGRIVLPPYARVWLT